MKTTNLQILILVIVLLSGTGLYAQQEPAIKNLELISASEKSAYQKLVQPHQQLVFNNYDLKYHRFYWFADPGQSFIRGAVTSYFVPTQPMMSSIQFELSDSLSADSAYFHGFMYGVNHSANVITVPFGEIVPVGTIDSVTVFYHGNPTTTGFGSFVNEVHNGAPAMYILSEPYGA